jgi:hypothetical protein
VPEAAQGVQAWDRYAYVNNNSVRYTDLTGYMVDDGDDGGCDSTCWDRMRQDFHFTNIFKGHGKDGEWVTEDWNYYKQNRDDFWSGKIQWEEPGVIPGWDAFALHVERLAKFSTDEYQFMRDFGLVFAGISATGTWFSAAIDARNGPTQTFLNEGNGGLVPQYLDSLDPTANQSHHYAGILYLSYFSGGDTGAVVNLARDIYNPKTRSIEANPGDIQLGTIAAVHGAMVRGWFWGYSTSDIARWINELSP